MFGKYENLIFILTGGGAGSIISLFDDISGSPVY
jgi:hypothetical protein